MTYDTWHAAWYRRIACWALGTVPLTRARITMLNKEAANEDALR